MREVVRHDQWSCHVHMVENTTNNLVFPKMNLEVCWFDNWS